MTVAFYVAAAIAVLATVMAVSVRNAMHALLYLIASFLAVAVIFFILGAYLVAALEVIIYAGAIMVLFVFVIMMLNPPAASAAGKPLRLRHAAGPALLGIVLVAELIYVTSTASGAAVADGSVSPKAVGMALFGPYVLGVEIASLVLFAALVGVFHLGVGAKGDARKEGA